MQCEEFEKILEQQDAGALPGPALAHMETCAGCRGLVADLGAIRDMALELDSDEVAPPERVWISLRNQLEAEGLIRQPRPVPQTASRQWWRVFQRPAFAGCFLTLLLIAASMISYRWSSPASTANQQLAFERVTSAVPSAGSLFNEEVVTVGGNVIPGQQDSAVNESIRRNLQVVDNSIAVCEKNVREQPDNQLAREYLYGAYQQKAELLATAMNRSITGGLQ